jgi:DNA-binding response OmpR family regulator
VVSELRTGPPDSVYDKYRHVPILMLTSVTTKTNVDFRDRVGTTLLPVDAFIEKPANPTEILTRIAAMLAATSSGR